MSLRLQPVPPVPAETARVAQAAFPHGNLYILLRDEIGVLFADEDFVALFPPCGQPAEAPWRLALVTIFQFVEGLSDRAAADAVRSRIDWKYMLSLDLTDSGFDSSVLSEFRTRIVEGQAECLLFDTLLSWCRERKLLKARGKQRTDSTHVFAAIRTLNRLQCAIETMRYALNSVAVAAPEWLHEHSRPEWLDRYTPRGPEVRIPSGKQQRQEFAESVGRDGDALLSAIYADEASIWLRELPAVKTLRRVWLQQFYGDEHGVHWRTEIEGLPPAVLFISSPYDADAHFSRKRELTWVGYKVYLSETCDADRPRLITNVETSAAPVADGDMTDVIHQHLAKRELLPKIHLADTGFLDSELLVESKEKHGVNLVGPTRSDYHWQSHGEGSFTAMKFQIDWQKQHAVCPELKRSLSWSPAFDGRKEVIKVKFSRKDCAPCPSRHRCTKAKSKRRTLSIRRQSQYEALSAARAREHTAEYKNLYHHRAGVEGTISQGTRAFGLRRSRYVGLSKTHLQHVVTATAMNFVRLANWLAGVPIAGTRQPAFAKVLTA